MSLWRHDGIILDNFSLFWRHFLEKAFWNQNNLEMKKLNRSFLPEIFREIQKYYYLILKMKFWRHYDVIMTSFSKKWQQNSKNYKNYVIMTSQWSQNDILRRKKWWHFWISCKISYKRCRVIFYPYPINFLQYGQNHDFGHFPYFL